MDSRKLAILCRALAENKKADQVAVLDVRELSTVTDYFVLGTGTSEPHLRAITEEITDELRKHHAVRPRAVEGTLSTGWLVLDFVDVIVHVMREEQRRRYDLDGLWGDAPKVGPAKPKKAGKAKAAARTSRATPAKPRGNARRVPT